MANPQDSHNDANLHGRLLAIDSSFSFKAHPPAHLFNFKLPGLTPNPIYFACPILMASIHIPQLNLRHPPHRCIFSLLKIRFLFHLLSLSPKGTQLCQYSWSLMLSFLYNQSRNHAWPSFKVSLVSSAIVIPSHLYVLNASIS